MAPCSAFALSGASASALFSVALFAIALSTDNWRHISVDRKTALRENATVPVDDVRYYDRVQGIFRVCFPHEDKPSSDGNAALYLSLIEEWCSNIDYYVRLVDSAILPDRLSFHGKVWFHLARSAIACFVLYIMFMAIGCVVGLAGCWCSSENCMSATAVLFLLAALIGTGGMGLWHWAQFYEAHKVYDARLNFFPSWPAELREASKLSLGWSYILAWTGIGLAYISSILCSCAAVCTRTEKREREHAEMMVRLRYNYPSLAGTLTRSGHPSYGPVSIDPMAGSGGYNVYAGSKMSSRRNSVSSIHKEKIPEFYSPAPSRSTSSEQQEDSDGEKHQEDKKSTANNSYISAGYPNMDYPNGDPRKIQYKSVVKELSDAKL